jgi:hypothetical protein
MFGIMMDVPLLLLSVRRHTATYHADVDIASRRANSHRGFEARYQFPRSDISAFYTEKLSNEASRTTSSFVAELPIRRPPRSSRRLYVIEELAKRPSGQNSAN